MKTWAGILTVVVALGVSACGGDPCGRRSPCPNDAVASQAERDQCRAVLSANQSAPCYGEVLGVLNCTIDNFVCGADGKTDAALSSTKATNNCAAARTNAQNCCAKNAGSTVCTAD